MKSTLPVIPDSYIPISSHNHEITQARRYGMDAYTACLLYTSGLLCKLRPVHEIDSVIA